MLCETFTLRAIARWLSPAYSFSRRISLVFRKGSFSAAIATSSVRWGIRYPAPSTRRRDLTARLKQTIVDRHRPEPVIGFLRNQ